MGRITGNDTAARIITIKMTTSISTSVKPDWARHAGLVVQRIVVAIGTSSERVMRLRALLGAEIDEMIANVVASVAAG